MAHLPRPGSQGGCTASPVDTSQTRHAPATDHTHAGRELLNHVFDDVWHERHFAKLFAWSFLGARLGLLVDLNTYRCRQRHGIGYERRATRSSVFDAIFAHWFGTWLFTSNLARVSRFHFGQEQWEVRAFLDCGWYTPSTQQGKRAVHSFGNWSLTAGNESMPQATPLPSEQPRRISRQHSTTLTNAFACGAQESQAGGSASLADVVREEVQEPTAQAHLCQRLAGAQPRLECVDGQLAAKIGSGTLPGDTVAGG